MKGFHDPPYLNMLGVNQRSLETIAIRVTFLLYKQYFCYGGQSDGDFSLERPQFCHPV